jgi:hypothetical protein
VSESPGWTQRSWQDLADQAASTRRPAHLTVLDSEGYPIPIRARNCKRTGEGFRLVVPRAAPWSEGNATLSFLGKEIFVGAARLDGGETVFHVERALPILPMMDDRLGMKPDVLGALNNRLAEEMRRRRQPIPVVPEVPPTTEGARLRAEAAKAIDAAGVGAGISE